MNKLCYGSNAAGRRKLRRHFQRMGKAVPKQLIATIVVPTKEPAPVKSPYFPLGSAVRITTEDYGESYRGEKGTVGAYDHRNGTVLIQLHPTKRKSLLVCKAEHLTAVTPGK